MDWHEKAENTIFLKIITLRNFFIKMQLMTFWMFQIEISRLSIVILDSAQFYDSDLASAVAKKSKIFNFK